MCGQNEDTVCITTDEYLDLQEYRRNRNVVEINSYYNFSVSSGNYEFDEMSEKIIEHSNIISDKYKEACFKNADLQNKVRELEHSESSLRDRITEYEEMELHPERGFCAKLLDLVTHPFWQKEK